MMRIHLILSCLIILSHQCSHLKYNTLFITSTSDEIMKIPMSQIFTSTNYDQITFQPVVPFFTIAAPLQEVEKVIIHGLQGQTVSIKQFKSMANSEPQHLMSILRSDDGLYYSEFDLQLYSTTPKFGAVPPSTRRPKSKCYDIALFTTIIVTECSDDQEDYFSIIKIEQSPPSYLKIEKPLDSFRKLDMIDEYLLRGTVDKLELYKEQDETLVFLITLDQDAMRVLLNKESFELQIKDFQIHTNRWVSILNASGELIILQFKEDSWLLINNIETNIPDVYSYDYNVYKNTYIILSKTLLYYKAITQQVFTANVNSKPSYKVYLLKSSILLLQEKTLVLYSQQLYKLYSKILGDSNYQINSNPNSDGFLVIDDEYIYRYATNNEYSLQFSAYKLPIEKDYRITKIVQKNKCEVEINYTAVDIDWKYIYSSQIPQALIAGSVFQDKVDVQLNSIFQGSNLKYQFQNNDILNIKVEQFQGIEILNIDDISDVIYRKSLSNINNSNIQIIQMHSDQQISGYTCEVISNLKLNCKSIFTKRQFDLLQDSDKQLWWFNQDSIFLAILQDQALTIYCVYYKENKFDQLTTINLGGNAKQIATDGIHLFISMGQSIQVYKISVENKAELISNLKMIGDIYASPIQKNLLFVESDIELTIISFEYEKMAIIWFTEINTNYDQKNLIIFRDHFARIIKTKDQEEYVATVYYFKNLNNIYLEKQIKINNHSALKLSQIQVNNQQNLFYIVGQQAQQYKLLIYKVDETSINSMFLSLQYTSTAQLSVSNKYCFITDQNANTQVQQNYYITGDNFVQSNLKENYQQVQYSKLITLIVQIKSDTQAITTQMVSAPIVNRGVSIIQTKSSLNFEYIVDGAQKHCLDLGQSWYSGQAFDITQIGESENITFVQTLQKQVETLKFSPYIQQLNSENLVQLIDNTIVLVKISDLTSIEFMLDETYQINKLLFIQDQYIFVETQKETQIYLKIIECKDSNCKLLEDELPFATSIDKVFLHQNNFIIYSNPNIFTYDTKGDPIKLSGFEQFYKFTLFSQPFFVEFQHLKNDVYQAISVDVRGNVYFNNIEISRTSSANQVFPQDVVSVLKLNQLYLAENSVCVGLVLRKDEVIIIYNNAATFSFKFEFDCTTKKLCDIKYFKLNGVYQQYREWILFNIYPITYLNENILSMIYWAQNHYELLLYDLETPSSKENPKLAIAHLIAPISEEDPGEMYQIQSFVYKYNGQLHLLASADDPTILQHYTLKRSAQVCTTAQQTNEIIKLNLCNSISNINSNLNITIIEDNPKPPSPPDDDDKKSFPIWAIILIVLGVLIIGIVILICCKIKSKNEGDDKKKVLLL